jgi:hypothetical protein
MSIRDLVSDSLCAHIFFIASSSSSSARPLHTKAAHAHAYKTTNGVITVRARVRIFI